MGQAFTPPCPDDLLYTQLFESEVHVVTFFIPNHALENFKFWNPECEKK